MSGEIVKKEADLAVLLPHPFVKATDPPAKDLSYML